MNDDLQRKKSGYLLELALEEQLDSDNEMSSYKSCTEDLHKFSDEHNKKIRELIIRADKTEKRGLYRKKHLRATACLIIALSVSTFTVTNVEAFRLPLMRFFSEVRAKSTKFSLQGENNFNLTKNYQHFEPQYIPDGFSVLQVNERKGTYRIRYVHDQKNLFYTFCFYDKYSSREIDTEDVEITKEKIDDNEVYIIEKNDEIRVWMIKDGHQFYLRGSINYDEAINIMKSIK